MKAYLDWKHLSFAHPYFFGLLVLIPIMVYWQYWGRKNTQSSLRLSSLSGIANVKKGWKAQMQPMMFILRLIAIGCISIALARPQSSNVTTTSDSDGIDIVMCMDISGSMLAEDFKPNRIECAKRVALNFVDRRMADRMGLVIFSGESFQMCPITIDHNVLKSQLNAVKSGMLTDGTSIGMGLAAAVNGLRSSKAKTKVIVLMTDGVNNTGLIDPLTALEIAKAYKVRVYTVGVGAMGQAYIPVKTPFGLSKQLMPVEIDEPLLRQMASQTGGKYFRATDNKSLEGVYSEIDKLEKTKMETSSYKHYAELFFPFAMIAVICLALELIARYTFLRSIT